MQTVDFSRVPLNHNSIIIDVGCGEGRHTIGARWFGAECCIGFDINRNDLQKAQQQAVDFFESNKSSANDASTRSANTQPLQTGCYFNQANALQLPLADNSVDIAVCSEVLEHIHPDDEVLAELERVIKPGGYLIVSVPRRWPEKICWWLSREYHQVEGGHIRIYRTSTLRQKIEALGLQFQQRHWAHALHSPYWWLRCLCWRTQESSRAVALYHRFLVWDLLKKPALTRWLDKLLNPVMGKSVVLYYRK